MSSRQCCNSPKNAAPQLHTVASTWSSCVELLIQRLFLELCATKNLRIYGGDARDAYAHSPAPEVPIFLKIDDTYAKWYKQTFNKEINRRQILPVQHSLQGHPESVKMWMRLIDRILIKEMGFTSTTHS